MSEKRFFSGNADDRKMTIRHVDCDGAITYETRQNVDPIVEFVAKARNRPKVRDEMNWTHLGEIPLADLGQMMRDGSLDDPKHIRRYLNERPKLKIYDGQL